MSKKVQNQNQNKNQNLNLDRDQVSQSNPEGEPSPATKSGFSVSWFVLVVVNALFIIFFIAIVVYCIRKNKQNKKLAEENQRRASLASQASPSLVSGEVSPVKSNLDSVSQSKPEIFTIQDTVQERTGHTATFSNQLDIEKGEPETSGLESGLKGRFRSVSRLAGRLSAQSPFGGSTSTTTTTTYNPVSSPATRMFTQNHAEIFPNKPAVYNPPKHEELHKQDFPADVENGAGNTVNEDRTLSQPSKVIKSEKSNKDDNGDSGFDDQVHRMASGDHLASSDDDLEDALDKLLLPQTDSKEKSSSSSSPNLAKSATKPGAISRTDDTRSSVGIQTSPVSWLNFPGAIERYNEGLRDAHRSRDPSPGMDDESSYLWTEGEERKYFVYLVTDSNPYFRKDCIGKVTLPNNRNKITLSELREHLLKVDDDNLKKILKRFTSFRFLSETYRFVAQNEAMVSVSEVYPTQGIFIKLNNEDTTKLRQEIEPRSNKVRTQRSTGPQVPSFISITDYSEKSPRIKKEYISGLNASVCNSSDSKKKRHMECTSPVPTKRRVHIQRKRLVFVELKKFCEYPHCTSNQRSIIKCGKCNLTSYCSPQCKRYHWSEHKLICTKPPWKF